MSADHSSPDELSVRPVSLRQAAEFVQEHHRHHDAPQGGLWALALLRGDPEQLVGVAIAGRPVSRVLQRQGACEIIRVCVLPEIPNGCSKLIARVRRVAQAMGYVKCVSYTLAEEDGASLRGAGFEAKGRTKGGSWDRNKRKRTDKHPTGPKTRWEAA